MPKFFIKHKNKLWFTIITFLLAEPIKWGLDKFLDQIFKDAHVEGVEFIKTFLDILNYKVSVSYLLSLILGMIVLSYIFKFVRKINIRKRRLVILKATYGKNEKIIDLTDELNKAVINNTLKIVMSNNIAGDPCIGFQKIGRVKYMYDSQILDKDNIVEGETIILPEPHF